jgi:hypothetical protein
MINDLITSAFELVGLACITADCRAVYRDKAVRGVSIWSRGVYGSWAVWNFVLFTSLQMPWAALVAAVSVVVYIVWLVLAVRYTYARPRTHSA